MDISLRVKIFSGKQFILALKKSCFLIPDAGKDLVSIKFFGHCAPGGMTEKATLPEVSNSSVFKETGP
jgi:hypothetical protein